MLTPVQDDYIEIVYLLEKENGPGTVRVTDIANQLGTRLPTVTRTVQRLSRLGYLEHSQRRSVSLSGQGLKVAREIVHRHRDLVWFFTDLLGLPRREAELDACQIEHGVSSRTAQRLHEFLEYVSGLDEKDCEIFERFRRKASGGKKNFRNLPVGRTRGWRA
jgi:DtxR family Mn-dependent transcriptional regulator